MTGDDEGSARELSALVRRAAAADAGAWDELNRRYDRDVRRVAGAFGLSGPDADDISQETWFTAYRRLVTLRSPTSLPCWLRSIARNQCRARLRTTPVTFVDVLEIDDDVDVSAEVEAAESAGVVLAAVQALSERDRLLIGLLFERRPYDEISEAMAMPIGSIGPTRCRILEKLRRMPMVSGLVA